MTKLYVVRGVSKMLYIPGYEKLVKRLAPHITHNYEYNDISYYPPGNKGKKVFKNKHYYDRSTGTYFQVNKSGKPYIDSATGDTLYVSTDPKVTELDWRVRPRKPDLQTGLERVQLDDIRPAYSVKYECVCYSGFNSVTGIKLKMGEWTSINITWTNGKTQCKN